jgi:hypothetical protein
MGGLTLDTGALFALERCRRDISKIVEAALLDGRRITAPANAAAEWWRGRTDRRDYVLRFVVVQEVDAKIAKLAGEALASLKNHVEVDAIRRLGKRVRRGQDRLERAVDRKAWARYLKLEELVNDRTSEETTLLIRWAFEAGQRHGVALGVQLVTCPRETR